ncbi:MFS general substrate transporter [Zopfia rhizophila CBS 207.26]|uniref:MFS general substrate transporter n=1 Tax=Zopfia rhizophila CBS 207.26 TaxID=1314779 RepID=A0A6A6D8Y5_9PEZI|nr:MFS general substrate transporter [Zopfia rhizophila CBS 207.26]
MGKPRQERPIDQAQSQVPIHEARQTAVPVNDSDANKKKEELAPTSTGTATRNEKHTNVDADAIVKEEKPSHASGNENELEEKPPHAEIALTGDSSLDTASTDSNLPSSPINLPTWRKLMITLSLCLVGFAIGFESSIGSALVGPIIQIFRVAHPLGLLNVSIYLKGWSFGTALFGPLSEVYGRQYPLYIGVFLFVTFQIPTAVAENVETILICRFLTGFFGSVPLIMVYGIFKDIYHPKKRDLAMNCWVTSLLTGAALGPIAGSYLVANRARGWRWVEYTTIILSSAIYLTVFFIPETHIPRLLQKHPKYTRPGDERDLARARETDCNRTSAKRLIDIWINRPFIMLFTDLVLFLMTLHSALAMGVLYISFETFMLPFLQTRRWLPSKASLPPYIILFLGILCGSLITSYFILSFFRRRRRRPEHRLLPVIIGAFLLSSGLFWFAWTNKRTLHWLGQAASCVFIGAGIFLILQQSEAYVLEIYEAGGYRDSALVATIFLRSLFAAGFTMASRPMYERVHVPWATSAWGFITMACIPIPIVVFLYGEKMRAKGRYTKASFVEEIGLERNGEA